jgi:hypothetical protein
MTLMRKEKILDKIGIIRWIAIALHTIVLTFALFVTSALTGGDIVGSFALIETDIALRQALSLSGLLLGGNTLGVVLLLTPMFRSFIGSCALVVYELAFLAASFMFLSLDYSFIIGIVVCAVLYVANVRRKVQVEI